MTRRHRSCCDSSPARCAFTLVESAVAIVVMAVLLVTALNTVGMSRRSQRTTSDRTKGLLLAEDLLSEILRTEYADPENVATDGGLKVQIGGLVILQLPQSYTLGPDSGEADGTRRNFDDVDDYHGWASSPPELRTGQAISASTGWTRSVSVIWANPWLLGELLPSDSGCKQITVTVKHNDVLAARLTAVKTVGLPPPNVDPVRILYVVANSSSLTSQERDRQSLFTSWGHDVSLIQANSSQSRYDSELGEHDIAYISEEVAGADVGTKLRSVSIGVVNEDYELVDDLGFAGSTTSVTETRIRIDSNTHYITSQFAIGWLTVFASSQATYSLNGPFPAAFQPLATTLTGGVNMNPSLMVLNNGDALYGGGTAAGRRVQLPWGADAFNLDELNVDGRKLLKRAIQWAASKDGDDSGTPACGDGTCNGTETPCSCLQDCGLLALFEQPGATCQDGLDNDCDGNIDCADNNCGADAACVICGDGTCQSGEDCLGCPADCDGKLSGTILSRFCCGNGILELAEGLGLVCDGNP